MKKHFQTIATIIRRVLISMFPAKSWRRWHLLNIMFPSRWFGVIGLLAICISKPLIKIRVGSFTPERIGHFTFDSALRYAESLSDSSSSFDVYCLNPSGPISNQFWYDFCKRNLRMTQSVLPIYLVGASMPTPPSWILAPYREVTGSRDINGILANSGRVMKFTEEEDARAREWLNRLGWRDGEKIVLLNVRDQAYLDSLESKLLSKSNWGKNFWEYHSYRNSKITTYYRAVNYLADEGFWVFRMGKVQSESLDIDNPRVVDYAFRQDRSDFLDVWLFANCSLCITTCSGPDLISSVYQRPMLAINFLPIALAYSWSPTMSAGKALYFHDGKRMSLPDHMGALFGETKDFAEANLVIRDLDSWEILEIVKEAVDWFFGSNQPTDGEVTNQKLFQTTLVNSPARKLHGFFHPLATVSTFWLTKLNRERSGQEAVS